jgi:diamine N-acetyltransferase
MQDTPLLIRRATPADVALIAGIGARTFEAAFGPDNRPQDMRQYIAANFSLQQIEHELADPRSIFLLAYEDEQLLGYAKLSDGKKPDFVDSPDPIELQRIYVDTHLVATGYGSALMQACLEAARAAGYRSIWLGVWERNARAIRFYEKWGFTTLGSQEFILGKDAQNDLVMGRMLSDLERFGEMK